MKTAVIIISAFILGSVWISPLLAEEPIIYPNKGQSKEKLEKDKYECYTWAKGQTGFDPMQPAKTQQPPQATTQGPKGERLAGAARGAALGVVVGGIAGDAGKGAAAGAAAGTMAGGMRSRQKARAQADQQEQKTQQEAAANAQERNDYDRAFGACLEGRGYTVK
jgi:hypothetical protein